MTQPRPRFSAPAAAPAPLQSAGEAVARQAELQAKAQRLTQNRLKAEAQYEQAERELLAIEREAQTLGVASLEEYQALIAETEAKDAEEEARFARELEDEARLQNEVEARLNAMDTAG